MKKIDVGQSIGILANVAVFVGVLLLVYELNQNRQMMEAQTRNSIAATITGILFQRANSPQLAEIMSKLDAGESLTAAESQQYQDMMTAIWRYRENVSYQYRKGLYEEAEYLAQREAWRRGLNDDAAQRAHWCARNSEVVAPEFYAEISGLLEKPCE